MIHLQNINKTYKGRNYEVKALVDLHLQIPKGQHLSIIGKSGSGKSSLIKIIGLLDFDFSGEYRFNDFAFKKNQDNVISDFRKKIGYVFQDFQLIDRYTVLQNMEIACVIKLGKVDETSIHSALEQVGMDHKKDSYPDELSGGQKQRVGIARAIISNPEVIIADEPTGAVDQQNTEDILRLLKDIHEQTMPSIIVVTHDIDVANEAQRIIELNDGRIQSDIFC